MYGVAALTVLLALFKLGVQRFFSGCALRTTLLTFQFGGSMQIVSFKLVSVEVLASFPFSTRSASVVLWIVRGATICHASLAYELWGPQLRWRPFGLREVFLACNTL